MSENIEKINFRSLRVIKLQAEYNQSIDSETRIKISMEHLEGLKELKLQAVRK